jgi:DNA-binding MarR family transcriptional regulator
MAKTLDLTAVENCACFNIRRVSRLLTQFYQAEARQHGMRATQAPILRTLRAKESWNMADLSEWLGMERTTLLRNLRPLQRDGLVRTRGGDRGGHVELQITEKGRTALAKLHPAWRSAQDKVVAIIGKERWSAIIGDLAEVAKQLKTK